MFLYNKIPFKNYLELLNHPDVKSRIKTAVSTSYRVNENIDFGICYHNDDLYPHCLEITGIQYREVADNADGLPEDYYLSPEHRVRPVLITIPSSYPTDFAKLMSFCTDFSAYYFFDSPSPYIDAKRLETAEILCDDSGIQPVCIKLPVFDENGDPFGPESRILRSIFGKFLLNERVLDFRYPRQIGLIQGIPGRNSIMSYDQLRLQDIEDLDDYKRQMIELGINYAVLNIDEKDNATMSEEDQQRFIDLPFSIYSLQK
ncbi:MAG: hypothetical protein J4473_02395 [Candidatus Aenigmarchaeota archaeon]|nr:hypothetical protein [Candidatus Aenigmarchaeota archaeon]